MIRKLVLVIILVPLAVAFITFAVANRQIVVVSLDLFDQAHPAIAISLPLFALILVFIIGGVVVGGVAGWLKQSKWRRAARRAQWEARELRAEVDELKRPGRSTTEPTTSGMPSDYAPRLTIPPPAE